MRVNIFFYYYYLGFFFKRLNFVILKSRDCDTHFTGPDCWSKTFAYFSNNLFQSIVAYKNAAIAVRLFILKTIKRLRDDSVYLLINLFDKSFLK